MGPSVRFEDRDLLDPIGGSAPPADHCDELLGDDLFVLDLALAREREMEEALGVTLRFLIEARQIPARVAAVAMSNGQHGCEFRQLYFGAG